MASDGARLALHLRGQGKAVQFQHGLGGDHLQTFEAFPELTGWALRTLECRGHGASEGRGPFSIAQFAQDVAEATPDGAVIGGISMGAVIGGISMGAAIALRLAVQWPGQFAGLVLVRPAWLTGAGPANMGAIAEVAGMIAAGQGWDDFARTGTHARLAREAPDNLTSLRGFFGRAPLDVTARLLADIAADGPGVTEAEIARIGVPVLVCVCGEDEIHPVSHGEVLAGMIPGARLVVLPPKVREKPAHLAALHAAITLFLKEF